MLYIKDNIQYPLDTIQKLHPNMSIPDGADLREFGYLPVELVPMPVAPAGQQATTGEPEEYSPGKWRQTWGFQPMSPPDVVTPFQAKAALLQAGMLPTVQALIDDPATDPLIKLAWEEALEFRRNSPAILGLASAMGWTNERLDALFIAADAIEI